jgi:hypothetical protein
MKELGTEGIGGRVMFVKDFDDFLHPRIFRAEI